MSLLSKIMGIVRLLQSIGTRIQILLHSSRGGSDPWGENCMTCAIVFPACWGKREVTLVVLGENLGFRSGINSTRHNNVSNGFELIGTRGKI